jgi:hypothetical protein
MQHYANTVQGFFGFEDFEFYKMMVDQSPTTAHFVEVGSFKGRSSSFMAVEIINSQKQIRFDCVDTWQGSEEHQAGQSHQDFDVVQGTLYNTFLTNMRPVEGYFNAVRLPSVEAAKQYSDQSLDLVFIDAAHDYENVSADIKAWLPKIKSGGVISGHDREHPPIFRSVNELLGAHNIMGACWYKKV